MSAASANPLEHVVQHPLVTRPAHLGALTPDGVVTVLSDQIVMMVIAAMLLAIFLPPIFRRRKDGDELEALVPGRFGNFVEMICQYLRKEVAEPALGEHTDRFVGYIWTVFFFILTVNLLGLLLPLGPLSSIFGVHIGGTATGNIWVTGTLAALTLVMMIANGIRLGGKHYLLHFNPGPWWLAPLLVPLEIIGTFAKIFALAVRLFANMIAGHILLAVLVGFILSAGVAFGALGGLGVAVPVVLGSLAIALLEVLVAVLQTFIFTFLTTLFLGMSVVFEHHEEHPGEEDHSFLAEEGMALK